MSIFHIDLLNTNLELFVEHYDFAIARNFTALIGEVPRGSILVADNDLPIDYRSNYVIYVNKSALWLNADPYYLQVRSNKTQPWETTIPSFARGVGYRIYAGGITDDGWQDNHLLFTLLVTRYHLTRLRVALEEDNDRGEYASRLKTWIEPRWGKGGKEGEKSIGYIVLNPKGAVAQGEREMNYREPATGYVAKIRETMYTYHKDTETQARWKAIMGVYAEWRKAEPGVATHKKLAGIVGVGEPYIKKMWGIYKPHDDITTS